MSTKIRFRTQLGCAADNEPSARYALGSVLVGKDCGMATDGRLAAFCDVETKGLEEGDAVLIPKALIPKSKTDLKCVYSTNGDVANVTKDKDGKASTMARVESGRYPRMGDVLPVLDPTDPPRVIRFNAEFLERIAKAINLPDGDTSQGAVTLLIQPPFKGGGERAIIVLGDAATKGLGVLMPLASDGDRNGDAARIAVKEYEDRRKHFHDLANKTVTGWVAVNDRLVKEEEAAEAAAARERERAAQKK